MTYKTKKKIANLILMPVFGIWPKLGFYLRGRMIMKLGAKIRAIRTHFPEFSFWRAKLMNGGGSFCFLVGGKYVIKIAKNYDENSAVRLAHEKEITDMVRKISKVRVPKIEIFSANGYSFMKYDIIAGRNLNKIPLARLIAHREKLGRQLANCLTALHENGIWHNDIGNNIIVDPKTMDLAGIIDWEFAHIEANGGIGRQIIEFQQFNRGDENLIKRSNLIINIMAEYYNGIKN